MRETTQQTPRSVSKEGEEVAPGATAVYGEDHGEVGGSSP